MEKCSFCENKTQLYHSGVPVCLACLDKRYAEKGSSPASYDPPYKPNPQAKDEPE